MTDLYPLIIIERPRLVLRWFPVHTHLKTVSADQVRSVSRSSGPRSSTKPPRTDGVYGSDAVLSGTPNFSTKKSIYSCWSAETSPSRRYKRFNRHRSTRSCTISSSDCSRSGASWAARSSIHSLSCGPSRVPCRHDPAGRRRERKTRFLPVYRNHTEYYHRRSLSPL